MVRVTAELVAAFGGGDVVSGPVGLEVRLIEAGALHLTTSARSVLGADLPLIAADVTVGHLLSHRSGIGDYLDEDVGHQMTDYVMQVPVHELATTERYLAVLGGHPFVQGGEARVRPTMRRHAAWTTERNGRLA